MPRPELSQDAAVALLRFRQYTLIYDLASGVFLAQHTEQHVTMDGHSPVECVWKLVEAGYLPMVAVEAFLRAYHRPDPPTDPTT